MKISNVFVFLAGVAIGSLAAVKIVKDKYHRYAQEEIQSVREYYYKKDKKRAEKEAEKQAANDIIVDNGYDGSEVTEEVSEDDPEAPFIIEVDMYGEIDDYEFRCLTYYKDGILTDNIDNPIVNVNETVGYDNLDKLVDANGGDAIYVRNVKQKTDYEIIKFDEPYIPYDEEEDECYDE